MRRAENPCSRKPTQQPVALSEQALRLAKGGVAMLQRSPAGTAEDSPPTGGNF